MMRPSSRVESLLLQILNHLRKRDNHHTDFSVMQLLVVIAQMLSLGSLFLAWVYRAEPSAIPLLLAAIALQTMSISLMLGSR